MSLAKVQKLLALAASANENEARNAAVHACRLIAEHGYVVREAEAPASASPERPDERPIADPSPEAYRSFYDIFVAPRKTTPAPPMPVAPPDRPPMDRARVRGGRGGWVLMASRWPGRCGGCGLHYEDGDGIYWRKGQGARCEACGPGL